MPESIVNCPLCGNELVDDGSLAGVVVSCPHCQGQLTMPGAASGPALPPIRRATTAPPVSEMPPASSPAHRPGQPVGANNLSMDQPTAIGLGVGGGVVALLSLFLPVATFNLTGNVSLLDFLIHADAPKSLQWLILAAILVLVASIAAGGLAIAKKFSGMWFAGAALMIAFGVSIATILSMQADMRRVGVRFAKLNFGFGLAFTVIGAGLVLASAYFGCRRSKPTRRMPPYYR